MVSGRTGYTSFKSAFSHILIVWQFVCVTFTHTVQNVHSVTEELIPPYVKKYSKIKRSKPLTVCSGQIFKLVLSFLHMSVALEVEQRTQKVNGSLHRRLHVALVQTSSDEQAEPRVVPSATRCA